MTGPIEPAMQPESTPAVELPLPEGAGLPERVKARREQLGLTIRALAKQLKISHATIVRIENGEIYSPRMDVLLALAKGLRVSVLWLMSGSQGDGNNE